MKLQPLMGKRTPSILETPNAHLRQKLQNQKLLGRTKLGKLPQKEGKEITIPNTLSQPLTLSQQTEIAAPAFRGKVDSREYTIEDPMKLL